MGVVLARAASERAPPLPHCSHGNGGPRLDRGPPDARGAQRGESGGPSAPAPRLGGVSTVSGGMGGSRGALKSPGGTKGARVKAPRHEGPKGRFWRRRPRGCRGTRRSRAMLAEQGVQVRNTGGVQSGDQVQGVCFQSGGQGVQVRMPRLRWGKATVWLAPDVPPALWDLFCEHVCRVHVWFYLYCDDGLQVKAGGGGGRGGRGERQGGPREGPRAATRAPPGTGTVAGTGAGAGAGGRGQG